MFLCRQIVLTLAFLLGIVHAVSAQQNVSDSLQEVLSLTADPTQRVKLLLDLQDLNEATKRSLPFSIRLFREAVAIQDTYAMSAAIFPIIRRYGALVEKEDSLRIYVRKLLDMTPQSPHQGIASAAEMYIAFYRLRGEYSREGSLKLAHNAIRWCDSLALNSTDIHRRVKELTIRGFAGTLVSYYEKGINRAYIPQTNYWEEAYRLVRKMPDLTVQRHFAELVYQLLSGAYNQSRNYKKQLELTNDYLGLLDRYYAARNQTMRRPYLYPAPSYVKPYQQLMSGTIGIKRKDLAKKHFDEFRARMFSGHKNDLEYNKLYFYETGYLWKGVDGDYAQSIKYTDSLITLLGNGKGYLSTMPEKIFQIHRDRSRLLHLAGQDGRSFEAYQRTWQVQDSLFAVELLDRAQIIRSNHEIDQLKLQQTRAVIRSRAAILCSFIIIGLLLIFIGVRLYRAWQRNRRLQADIQRHILKAQESERMKSNFIDTICRGISPPLEALDHSTHALMVAGANTPERLEQLNTIHTSTGVLLSTLDNMLEAANLDSLTDSLRLENTDIDELCRAELLSASRLRQNPDVEYRIEASGSSCIVQTHAIYFALVIRALLDNAGKFTQKGTITLAYELLTSQNQLCVRVTDTGCGIPPEQREAIFRPLGDRSEASHGLSLALCSLIAQHLSGSIRLDEQYTAGSRFMFTIPTRP